MTENRPMHRPYSRPKIIRTIIRPPSDRSIVPARRALKRVASPRRIRSSCLNQWSMVFLLEVSSHPADVNGLNIHQPGTARELQFPKGVAHWPCVRKAQGLGAGGAEA